MAKNGPCIHCWDPYLLGQQRKLENINKRSCKIILNNDYNTYESALVSLKWLPTHVRREYNKLTLCYKIIHNMIALDFNDFLVIEM